MGAGVHNVLNRSDDVVYVELVRVWCAIAWSYALQSYLAGLSVLAWGYVHRYIECQEVGTN
jgi:hypothetical protein